MFSFTAFDNAFSAHSMFSPRVYVISDSEHKRIKAAQVKEQIQVLETRADQYRKYLATTEEAIAQLQKDIAALPEQEAA